MEECKQKCIANVACKGIEHINKRCEIWTRPEGIGARLIVCCGDALTVFSGIDQVHSSSLLLGVVFNSKHSRGFKFQVMYRVALDVLGASATGVGYVCLRYLGGGACRTWNFFAVS